ncbi:MAG: hypothetical protein ACK5C3_05105, partial [bacterium]
MGFASFDGTRGRALGLRLHQSRGSATDREADAARGDRQSDRRLRARVGGGGHGEPFAGEARFVEEQIA